MPRYFIVGFGAAILLSSLTFVNLFVSCYSNKFVNSFAAWMTVSRSCLIAGHLGEADNVCEEDGHVLHGVHVERTEDGADIALQ